MFTLGINTALRASDLLKITYGQLSTVTEGEFFNINEKKTSKKRIVTVNQSSYDAIRKYLKGPRQFQMLLFFYRKNGSMEGKLPLQV
ncbi:MAG: tyrosine-type recombinase/integrase [Oligoflexales bacterium]